MTKTLIPIDIYNNAWGDVFDRLNGVIDALDNDIVTVNNDPTVGDVEVIGEIKAEHLTSNTAAITTIESDLSKVKNLIASIQIDSERVVANTMFVGTNANTESLNVRDAGFINHFTANTAEINSLNVNMVNYINVVDTDISRANVDSLYAQSAVVNTASITTAEVGTATFGTIIMEGRTTLTSYGQSEIIPNSFTTTDSVGTIAYSPITAYGKGLVAKANAGAVRQEIGLGNLDNTSDANKPVSAPQQAAIDLRVPKTTRVIAGTGVTGGGALSDDVQIGLNATTQASLQKADSAIQAGDAALIPTGGTSGQVLIKSSNFDYDVEWVDSLEDYHVSYVPQTLTIAQQTQVRANIGLDKVNNTPDAEKPISTAVAGALAGKASSAQGTKADSAVQSVNGKSGNAVTLTKADVGLDKVNNTPDAEKPISTATQTALSGKVDKTTSIITGGGLTGGGALDSDKTIGLSATTLASLQRADRAIQALGGMTGQILAKNSAADNDVAWISSEAATAISYAPQTLTTEQQEQARENVGLDNVDNTSDAAKPISTATQTALNGKAGTAVATTTINGLMSAADKVKSEALADLAFKDSVAVSDIDATGVPSDSTYLRGDGSWAPASGGGGGGGQVHTVGAGTGIAVNAADPVNPSVALNPATIASLTKADTALQTLTQGANITITGTGTARTIAATVPAAPVTSVAGKTGVVTLAKADVGLGNVDNTSDANKPVSTAQAAAISAKVTKAGDTGLGGFTSAGHNLGNLSGTVTPEPTATSNFKYAGNNAAFTLAAPTTAGYYTIAILVTNAASGAGAMTATGFSKVHGTFSDGANKKQLLTIEVFGSDKVLTIREAN